MSTDHQHFDEMDIRAEGSVCLSCQTNFNTRPQLLTHLRYRKALCYNHYLEHIPPMDSTKLDQLKADEQQDKQARKQKGLRPDTAMAPAIRPPGYKRQARQAYNRIQPPTTTIQPAPEPKIPLPPLKHQPTYILLLFQ